MQDFVDTHNLTIYTSTEMISWFLTFHPWDKQVWQPTFSSSSAVDLLSIFSLVKQKITITWWSFCLRIAVTYGHWFLGKYPCVKGIKGSSNDIVMTKVHSLLYFKKNIWKIKLNRSILQRNLMCNIYLTTLIYCISSHWKVWTHLF